MLCTIPSNTGSPISNYSFFLMSPSYVIINSKKNKFDISPLAKLHKIFVFWWTEKRVFNLGDSVVHSTTQTTHYCRPWTQKVWDGSIVSTFFFHFFLNNLEKCELNLDKLISKFSYRLHSKKIKPQIEFSFSKISFEKSGWK